MKAFPYLALATAIVVSMATATPQARAQDLAAAAGQDGPLTPEPNPARISLTQQPDAALPLETRFADSTGRAIRLGDEFAAAGRDAPPVILVLGYYRCPGLCGLLMQGLLEALHTSGIPAASYRIVFASVDPDDAPADAATRRRIVLDYARFLDGADGAVSPPSVDLLIGPPASITALTRSVGYTYQAAASEPGSAPASLLSRFGHPAGIVVCTPDGRISRYLMGVRFDPQELRAAIVDAGGGRIGPVTDRIALICAHFDAHLGRWSMIVLTGMRAVGLATIVLIGVLAWKRRAPAHEGGE